MSQRIAGLPPKQSKFLRPQFLMAVMIFLSIIIIGVAMMGSVADKAEYERLYQENLTKIAGLQAEIDNLASLNIEPDEIQQAIYSAVDAGNKVASYQTEFQTCYQSLDVDKALQENMKSLTQYMDLSSGAGYEPWFVPEHISDTSWCIWQFATNYELASKDFPVLWVCYDNKSELVAYATGTYHADDNKFSDIVFTHTTYGITKYTTVDLTDDAGTEDVFDTQDTIDIPDGYSLDANGNLVDAAGNPYVSDVDGGDDVLEWAGGFANDFGDDFSDAIGQRQNAVNQAKAGES